MMNQFFYESRGKEKVKELLEEGQQSQAFVDLALKNLDCCVACQN